MADTERGSMDRISLLHSVFRALHEGKIGYCVLRNYDFLLEGRAPRTVSERSVDLCVSHKDFERFDALMAQLGFEKRKQQFSRKHTAYFRVDCDPPVSFDVQVGGVHWNDMKYLDEGDLLLHAVQRDFLRVPSDNDTVAMLLLHSILGKRRFKPEYWEWIRVLWGGIDRQYVFEKLAAALSAGAAREIMLLAGQGKPDEIISRRYRYIGLFLASPRRLVVFIPLCWRWLQWKKFWKASPIISIIGPDGAGKSTMVSVLQKYLEAQGRKVAVVYSGRGKKQMLPMPIRLAGYYYKGRERRRDQTRLPNLWRRRIMYTLYSPVFMFDLGLRYLCLIFPKRRSKHIVITDRYGTDIWLMRHVPLFLKKLYLSLFPLPTLTFYLYQDPEILQQRRPSEKTEEFRRQLGLFAELKKYLPMVDVKTVEQQASQEQVLQAVMRYLYREWW